jgi:hypothetical protein
MLRGNIENLLRDDSVQRRGCLLQYFDCGTMTEAIRAAFNEYVEQVTTSLRPAAGGAGPLHVLRNPSVELNTIGLPEREEILASLDMKFDRRARVQWLLGKLLAEFPHVPAGDL